MSQHVMGVDEETYALGRLPGSVWVVKLGEDGWYHVDHTIDGQNATQVIGTGRGFSTPVRHMVEEYMAFLGLVRHEPEPGSPPDVVETWHVDPDVPAPPFVPPDQL